MIRCVTDVRGLFSAITLLAMAWGASAAVAESLDRTGTLWAPFLEWSLENLSWSGNPFDLEATVTFTHADSGETRTTQMFYDEEDTWKFRFTATRTGIWTFTTASDDADLDGRQGTVTVQPNPDPKARGFIVAHGNKYAWQAGQDGEVEAFVPNIYMNLVEFGVGELCGWTAVTPTFSDPEVFTAYLDEAEAHGCNGVFARMGNQWFQAQSVSWDAHDSEDPDPVTFRAMEQAIGLAHQRGMLLHIWVWGDEGRRWTPIGVPGGINGEVDRRMQRYKAARLGPLPGYTMSYGSDLNEWVEPEQVESWADYLMEHSGWDMLLSARQSSGFISPEMLPVASYDDRLTQNFYQQARQRLDRTPPRPVLFERRFSYLRDGVWDMDTTRRAFWQFAMAGGAASIWGHYPAEGVCSVYFAGDYPHPEQLRTHRRFWQGRFLPDMEPANEMSGDSGTWVLKSGNDHAVFYREDTESIHLDLSVMDGPQPVVAVDTTQDENMRYVGTLEPAEHTWQAPYRSDWAIAVGVFPGRTDCDFAVNPPPAIGESHAYRNLPADPQSFAYQLINVTAGEAAYAVETTDVEGNPVSYSWLELDTSGGTIPEGETETAAATITDTDLPADTYTAYLRFTDLNADCEPVVHRIDLTITDCLMQADHEEDVYLIANPPPGPLNPVVFTVTNVGVGPLSYTVQKVGECDWLTLNKSGGGPLSELGGTDQVTAWIDPTDLPDGLYGCTLSFIDSCSPSVELLRTVQVSVRYETYRPYWVADFSDWSGSDNAAVANYTDTEGGNPNSFTVTYTGPSGTGWLTQGNWAGGPTARFMYPVEGSSGGGRARFGTTLPDAMTSDAGMSFAWRARYGNYAIGRGPVQLQISGADGRGHRPYFRVQYGTTMRILNNGGSQMSGIDDLTLPVNVADGGFHDWAVSVISEGNIARWTVWLNGTKLLFGGTNGQHVHEGWQYSFRTYNDGSTVAQEMRLGELQQNASTWDFEFDCVAYRDDLNDGLPMVCEAWIPSPPPIPGDFDGDGDVDLGDFGLLQRCYGVSPLSGDCVAADLNDDGVVDQEDFEIFKNCFGGANQPPGC